MGFGGGYEAPKAPEYVPPPQKEQIQKPVTEATTAARDAQKEKASKAAGIQASILTSPLQNQQSKLQKTLLGQ